VSPALPGDHRGTVVALAEGGGRIARGTVAGAVCVALSLGWHGAAGGVVPGVGALVLLTCLAAGVCTWWADRRRGPAALALLTVALQVGLHVVLQLVTGHPPASLGAGAAMTVAHLVAAVGVAWVLARGDDVLWELCAVLVRVWTPARPVTPAPSRPAAPVRTDLWWEIPPHGVVLARALPRRGPPVPLPA
jgi:hypothetical protein